jgi:hypothetical protein
MRRRTKKSDPSAVCMNTILEHAFGEIGGLSSYWSFSDLGLGKVRVYICGYRSLQKHAHDASLRPAGINTQS